MTDYKTLATELRSLVSGVPHKIANLANASALIYNALENINWAGFYLLEGDVLVLAPFGGKPACIEIPVGRGVCGTAVAKNETIVVPDVHNFVGHIACDSASRSEIVIPLTKDGKILGVLDIDSPVTNRFNESDKEGLEALARIIEEEIF